MPRMIQFRGNHEPKRRRRENPSRQPDGQLAIRQCRAPGYFARVSFHPHSKRIFFPILALFALRGKTFFITSLISHEPRMLFSESQ